MRVWHCVTHEFFYEFCLKVDYILFRIFFCKIETTPLEIEVTNANGNGPNHYSSEIKPINAILQQTSFLIGLDSLAYKFSQLRRNPPPNSELRLKCLILLQKVFFDRVTYWRLFEETWHTCIIGIEYIHWEFCNCMITTAATI